MNNSTRNNNANLIGQIVQPEMQKLTVFNHLNIQTVQFEYEISFDHFDRRAVVNSALFSPPGMTEPQFDVTLDNNDSFISLKLNVNHIKQNRVNINYKCSILGQQGEKLNTVGDKLNFNDDNVVMLKYHKWKPGNRQVAPLHRAFQNKVVTFHCQFLFFLKHTTEMLVGNPNFSVNENGDLKIDENVGKNDEETGQLSLLSDMEALWSNRDKYADFTFKFANGKLLKAHKLILGTRSPVFGAMFENNSTKESQENFVEIVDSTLEAFEAFLLFVYTGKCTGIDQFGAELLAIADKYQVNSLKTICENHLGTEIFPTNMFNLLLLADTHGALKLKDKVVDFISKNFSVQNAVKAAFLLNNPEQLVQQIRALEQ